MRRYGFKDLSIIRTIIAADPTRRDSPLESAAL